LLDFACAHTHPFIFRPHNDYFRGKFTDSCLLDYIEIEVAPSPISGRISVAGGIYNESKPKIHQR
jgi:hypothetical protein